MTTPRLVPLRRMTLVQPPADEGCTQTTYRASLDHTASAQPIGEAAKSDAPTPREIEHYRMGWWWGLTCGGCAVGLVMALAVASFVFGLKG